MSKTFKAGHARVNITTLVNSNAIREEKRDGRDVIIVPSATLPDNVVMNGIQYPADEIAKGFKSLERKPAPLGHPTYNGEFVSALDPEGINLGWIGAWNENVRQEKGRVLLDKVIDVAKANESEGGKRVLDAIRNGKPIHTSTGLLCNLEESNSKEFPWIARNMQFDHDAILLDQPGAATPEQGVGIFVNSNGQTEKIQVVNSVYEQTENELDWALEQAARALERRSKVGVIERMKAALIDAFGGQAETTTNEKDDDMSKEELDKLSGKVDALSESLGKIGETIGNAITGAIKPLVDAHNAAAATAAAAAEAEKAELVGKVVKANVLTEEAAKATAVETLRALVANIKTEMPASRLVSGFQGNNKDTLSQFKAPKAS